MKIYSFLAAVTAASPLCGQVVIDATFDSVANDTNNVFNLLANSPQGDLASFDSVTGVIDRGPTNFSNAGIVSATSFDVLDLGPG